MWWCMHLCCVIWNGAEGTWLAGFLSGGSQWAALHDNAAHSASLVALGLRLLRAGRCLGFIGNATDLLGRGVAVLPLQGVLLKLWAGGNRAAGCLVRDPGHGGVRVAAV